MKSFYPSNPPSGEDTALGLRSVLSRLLSRSALLGVVTAAVVACGGGGGGTGGAAGAVDDLTTVASGFSGSDIGGDGSGSGSGSGGADGAAGDGGPIKRGTVVLTCSNNARQYTGPTDDAGKYLISFNPTDCAAPYLVRVIDVGGNTYASMTADTPAAGKVVRINITPMTDKIVSDIVQPLSLGATSQNFTAQSVTAALSSSSTSFTATLATAKANLNLSVRDALSTAGVLNASTFDPVKDIYLFNGTGADAVLESISHTRDPQTGRTVLLTKLVSVGNTATPTRVEITAAAPLATASVNTPGSPGLNFSKLEAWVTRINTCLAEGPAGTTVCEDNVISDNYQHNSMDFFEHFKALISETSCGADPAPCHVQASTVRNAVLLFEGSYPGSTATYSDLAVVEVTIKQPKIGAFYVSQGLAAVAVPVEYTRILVFKRDDSLVGLTAGNWVLHGNQRNYDFSVEARYDKFNQINPARNNNLVPAPTKTGSRSVTGNPFTTTTVGAFTNTFAVGTQTAVYDVTSFADPSVYNTSIRLFANPSVFNTVSRTWVSANIQAIRVTGAGLPAAGIVMMANHPSICGADDYLSIANDTGILPIGMGAVNNSSNFSSNNYRLASVLQSDTSQASWYTALGRADRRAGNLTDFSGLVAYNRYTFEIRRTDGTTVTEYARILAPVTPPASLAGAQWNDPTPSTALVTAPAINTSAADFLATWTNNPSAAFIEAVATNSGAYILGVTTPSFTRWNLTKSVAGASSLNSRPTSQATGYPTDTNCTGGSQYPAVNANPGEYRQITLRNYQNRSRMYNTLGWTN